MRTIFLTVFILMRCAIGYGQQQIDTTKFTRVPGSGTYIRKSDSSKFMHFDGRNIFDIRKASRKQLEDWQTRKKIADLSDDRFWGLYVGAKDFPRHSLALRFEQHTGAKVYNGNFWTWGTLYKKTILIEGESDIEIIDGLITPANAKDYRYRIIQNDDKELVGWTEPSTFKQTKNKLSTYCFLATIKLRGNQVILVEIYNLKNYKDRDAIIIDSRPTRKLNFWASVGYRSKTFRSTVLTADLIPTKGRKRNNFVETKAMSDIKFRLGDSLVKMQFFSHHQATPYNYQIDFKRVSGGKQEHVELGDFNGTYDLYKEYWNKPGIYEITFTPKLSSIGGSIVTLQKEKAVTYKFTVLPPLNVDKQFSAKELALILVVICAVLGTIAVGIIVYVKRKDNKKLAASLKEKEISKNKLDNIRSQLNPHFLFNALAGIQNLMNQRKVDDANNYIAKFARLTRNVLLQKESISLAEERDLLNDYLQMEQLRFGFSYRIDSSNIDNVENIEIPSMLLQPFVENAVKHGIAEKRSAGEITVSFIRDEKDLELRITDNGTGFNADATFKGLGLQLSKNRITLLNSIYPSSPIILHIVAGKDGTCISIKLTQWL